MQGYRFPFWSPKVWHFQWILSAWVTLRRHHADEKFAYNVHGSKISNLASKSVLVEYQAFLKTFLKENSENSTHQRKIEFVRQDQIRSAQTRYRRIRTYLEKISHKSAPWVGREQRIFQTASFTSSFLAQHIFQSNLSLNYNALLLLFVFCVSNLAAQSSKGACLSIKPCSLSVSERTMQTEGILEPPSSRSSSPQAQGCLHVDWLPSVNGENSIRLYDACRILPTMFATASRWTSKQHIRWAR